MQEALGLAAQALFLSNPNPRVGCVLVGRSGAVIGRGFTQQAGGPHAEVMALRDAAAQGHSTQGASAYVTLEPCAMCAMALVHARVARVVYGASDPKTGACGSVFDLIADPRHNHRVEVVGGVLGDEAGRRLTNYFRAKRGRPLV